MIDFTAPLLVVGVALALVGNVLGFGKFLEIDETRSKLLDGLGYFGRTAGTCIALIAFLSETSALAFGAIMGASLIALFGVLAVRRSFPQDPDETPAPGSGSGRLQKRPGRQTAEEQENVDG